MKQDLVDYTALHRSHEVILRVEMLAQRLVELKTSRSAAVAEIGLGSGDTTRMLVDRFDDVTCVDLEQDRIGEVAEFIRPQVAKFICGNAATVTLDRQFDHIFLMGLLEHCPDGEAVLCNVRKYIEPYGRVHVLVNNAGSIHRHLGVQLQDIVSVRDLSPSDIRQGHHRVYTPNELYADVSKAGFVVEYADLHYLKPLPSKMMDELPLEISRAFVALGRQFPQFAAYTYLEATLA